MARVVEVRAAPATGEVHQCALPTLPLPCLPVRTNVRCPLVLSQFASCPFLDHRPAGLNSGGGVYQAAYDSACDAAHESAGVPRDGAW